MGYKNAMYLLSVLYGNAEDKKDEVAKLFKEAMSKTEEFQELDKLLGTTEFLGKDSEGFYNESKGIMEEAIWDIKNSTKHLKQMELMIEKINYELDKTERLLISPKFFDDDFTLIKSNLLSSYKTFYMVLANAICYFLVSQFGTKAIENLIYNRRASFKSIVKLVNQQYANGLLLNGLDRSTSVWVISNVNYGGDNLTQYKGFQLEYKKHSLEAALSKVVRRNYERVTPYLYAANSSNINPIYIGCGNLIGVDINSGLSLLDSEIITTLNVDVFGEKELVWNNPIGQIKEAIKSECFCISPENFTAALNRWAMNKAVLQRKKNHVCVFCGKSLESDTITCKNHFNIY